MTANGRPAEPNSPLRVRGRPDMTIPAPHRRMMDAGQGPSITSILEADDSGAMGGAAWSGSLVSREKDLLALKARLAPVFRRRVLKTTACAFLDGLLSGIARKTGWLTAKQAGDERPYRMQSFLGRSRWDEDALCDEIRAYVV